ncbi:MAG: hypothetical protein A2V66_11910 [Ignavibacteria bacterium RBG_13_36_8]|nr:MAG: hypothetical protein A2V66_11910 [Ignavibacteria bacterium RBG_13_36_8]
MKILDSLQIIVEELDKKVNENYTGKLIIIYNMKNGGIGNIQVQQITGENERIYSNSKEKK